MENYSGSVRFSSMWSIPESSNTPKSQNSITVKVSVYHLVIGNKLSGCHVTISYIYILMVYVCACVCVCVCVCVAGICICEWAVIIINIIIVISIITDRNSSQRNQYDTQRLRLWCFQSHKVIRCKCKHNVLVLEFILLIYINK